MISNEKLKVNNISIREWGFFFLVALGLQPPLRVDLDFGVKNSKLKQYQVEKSKIL